LIITPSMFVLWSKIMKTVLWQLSKLVILSDR
jgi:hypothetical protein